MPLPDTTAGGAVAASSQLSPALAEICKSLSLPVSTAEGEALLGFLSLLQRWNATYNLTSVRDPAQMLTQHLADCLTVAFENGLDEDNDRKLEPILSEDPNCGDVRTQRSAARSQASTTSATWRLASHSRHWGARCWPLP